MSNFGYCVAERHARDKPADSSQGTICHNLRELVEHHNASRAWKLAAQKLAAENRRSSEFMAVLSHELRGPLGAIRGAAWILRKQKSLPPEVVEARLLIERQAIQMARLVEDLCDVSRIRGGQLTLRRERIDLCAVLAHSVQALASTMRQRQHSMTTSIPEDPIWLQGDPARLQQVFVNLLTNAAKYTDVGGEIGLCVKTIGRDAVICIHDSGIGIAPHVLPRVFDLFVQADPASRRSDGGLGIGLALVRSLVENHGGCVSAASAGCGQGTEFTVRLPISPS